MKKLSLLIYISILFTTSCNKSNLNENNTLKNKTDNRFYFPSENMLWNDNGVTNASYKHTNLYNGISDPNDPNSYPIYELCDLSEGDLVGNPPNVWPYEYNTTNGSIHSPNASAPSFILVTEGYKHEYFNTYPGFLINVQNEGTGLPLEFKCFNNAKLLSSDLKLREVGVLFNHWYTTLNEGRWGFKDQYILNDFESIKPSFEIRLDNFNDVNSPNTTLPTTYITTDFRIKYFKENEEIRSDVLGVLFYNPNNYDMNGNSLDNIFYDNFNENSTTKRVLLHGNNLGLISNEQISDFNNNTFITIEFDFKNLIEEYLPPPPPGLSYDDAYIVGYDIYSSTRCANIEFSLKNIYLNGISN